MRYEKSDSRRKYPLLSLFLSKIHYVFSNAVKDLKIYSTFKTSFMAFLNVSLGSAPIAI